MPFYRSLDDGPSPRRDRRLSPAMVELNAHLLRTESERYARVYIRKDSTVGEKLRCMESFAKPPVEAGTPRVYRLTEAPARNEYRPNGPRVWDVLFTSAERRWDPKSKRSFWYLSWHNVGGPAGLDAGSFGSFRLYDCPDEAKVWQWTRGQIEDTGRTFRPAPRWYPRPGDRGYDLMC
jgi:hypothetical protein